MYAKIRAGQSVDDFVVSSAPSRMSGLSTSWIHMRGPPFRQPAMSDDPTSFVNEALPRLAEWQSEVEVLKQNRTKVGRERTRQRAQESYNEMQALARKYNLTSGKWLYYANDVNVDKVWSKVAKACHEGKLGMAAKIAPAGIGTSPPYVCCAYVCDFHDAIDCERVLRHLMIDLNLRIRSFKADWLTHLNLNSPQIKQLRWDEINREFHSPILKKISSLKEQQRFNNFVEQNNDFKNEIENPNLIISNDSNNNNDNDNNNNQDDEYDEDLKRALALSLEEMEKKASIDEMLKKQSESISKQSLNQQQQQLQQLQQQSTLSNNFNQSTSTSSTSNQNQNLKRKQDELNASKPLSIEELRRKRLAHFEKRFQNNNE